MNILKAGCVLFILLGICSPASLYAPQAAPIRPEDSLVVVTSSAPIGKRAGNAFVIGDGTLVVTAHHLVFEESEQGEHQMPGLVSLVSPYLGQACYGEILAADEELDLAVLKAAWQGHPALQLADDDSIFSAERVQIIGMPEVIHGIGPDANEPFPESMTFQREVLPGDFVAVRQRTPRFISLRGIGQLGDGWSGSPMLLPGSCKATGCFVRLHGTKGQRFVSAQGPAISQVKRLVVQAGQEKSLHPVEHGLSRAKDATDVFLLTLHAYRHYLGRDYDRAFERARSLIGVRPESVFAYTLAASVAEEQTKFDDAERYYQEALRLDPNAANLKIYYAQFLSKHQPDKALEILQRIWQSDRYKPYVALLMFNVLSERGEFGRCAEFLNEALKVSPNNAYLWVNLGGCQFHLGEANDAIISLSKAVKLLPETGPFRGQLAQLLEKQGRLDDAERHFRKLLQIEPDNPVVHFWLAQFLAKHQPTAKKEALKEAQVALELPTRGGLPRQVIEKFISSLQSESGQKPPE